MRARPDLFDDDRACFFGVTRDPGDESAKRIQERYPGYRFFLDFDDTIARLYGGRSVACDASEIDACDVVVRLNRAKHCGEAGVRTEYSASDRDMAGEAAMLTGDLNVAVVEVRAVHLFHAIRFGCEADSLG